MKLRHWALAATLTAALGLAGCGSESVESLLASGNAFAAKSDHKAAVIQFKAALQKDPQSGEARYLLGKALLDASDPAAAVMELNKAQDQKFDSNRVVPALARALLFTGQDKKVTDLYGEMPLDDKLALASLKTTVATAWAAQGQRDKTEAAIAAALQAVPDFPPALVMQARIQGGLRNFDEAMALVDRALKADEKLFDAWHLKGELLAYAKNDRKGANEAFRKAVSIEPASVASHLALISDRIAARDLPGAQAQADQLRKVLPQHPLTVNIDAQLAFWKRDFKRARELSQTLLKVMPASPGVLLLAGAIEGQLGSLVLAESHLVKALQINPRMGFARVNLAEVYLRMGQPAKALEALQPLMAAGVRDADVYALAGQAQLSLGDAKAAESAFRQAMSITPDNTRVRTALALTNFSRGEADAAFAELQAIAGESAKDTFADQAIISARLSRREYDEALKAANAMLAKEPGRAATLALRGRIQRLRQDYPAARNDFEQALKADPALFAATTDLASLDLLENKPEQARERLQASLKTEPRNHFARLALADMRLRANAPLDEVRQLLAEGITLSPTEPTLRLQLIDLLARKRQFKDALSVAQDAAAALPNDLRVLDAMGRAQMEAGDVEQAVSTFRRVADVDQRSALPYLRLADIYRATNRKPAAETALRKALDVAPQSVPAQEALASLMIGNNRLREAVELARTMQQQRPREVGGYLFEATVHMRQKAVDQALTAMKRGLAVKGHDPALAGYYYLALQRNGRAAEADQYGASWNKANPDDMAFEYLLATTAMGRKDYDQAETRLHRIVKLRPDYPAALNNLAWVLASRGKPGGVATAQRAVALAPDKPEFMDTLALALLVDKQAGRALELQKRVVELRPTEPSYRLSLARIAIEVGDKALARSELERLKALGASYPQQAEVSALAQKL
ncbi:MAG: PEP-CTERM system TPR-repeat protein PrsT [Rubrivivax sp.]|nr:PEP-CTERM system TPR-repeat protein PrsT [Rubrivivax sp.]